MGFIEQKCPYCAGFEDESCKPIYERHGLKVMIDGGFMYFFLNSGYKQVFEIDFCPKCGANLRE